VASASEVSPSQDRGSEPLEDLLEEHASSSQISEDNLPDDIVSEIIKRWRQLGNASNQRPSRTGEDRQAYTMETFTRKWVEYPPRAGQLAQLLLDPRIRDALSSQGVTVSESVSKEEKDAEAFTTVKTRKEMRALLSTPPFGDFEPHKGHGTGPTTVEALYSTT
jgi:hypothetical protein